MLLKNIVLINLIIIVSMLSLWGQDSIEMEEKIKLWMEGYHVPAVGIGIIEDNKLKYVDVIGDLKKDLPASKRTIFNIASVSKPVFTMFVLQLIKEGQWNLDEPLKKYWVDPDLEGHAFLDKLNTKHILAHQSGFSNWRHQNPDNKLKFNFEPGTDYQYSGEGFEYLKIAIERKFEKNIAELMDSHFFKPLGMADTRLSWDEELMESNFAYWHNAEGELLEQSSPETWNVGVAGTVMTSIDDFCRFSLDVIGKANSSNDLYKEMSSIIAPIKKDYGKGLGWEVVRNLPGNEYALTHSGWNPGVKTMALLLPESKRGLIVFTNGDNGYNIFNLLIKETIDFGELFIRKMAGIADRKLIELDAEEINSYAGEYLDSYGRKLSVKPIDGGLEVAGEGVPTNKIYPISDNVFVLKEYDVQFQFSSKDDFKIVVDGKTDCTAERIK